MVEVPRLERVGIVFCDFHAGTGATLVSGMEAHDVVWGHLHHDHEAPSLRVGPLFAHVKRHEHGAAVRGDGVERVRIAGTVVELVEYEVPHVPVGASTVGLSVAKSWAVHDEHVLRG